VEASTYHEDDSVVLPIVMMVPVMMAVALMVKRPL
jgi:hypothetical protein